MLLFFVFPPIMIGFGVVCVILSEGDVLLAVIGVFLVALFLPVGAIEVGRLFTRSRVRLVVDDEGILGVAGLGGRQWTVGWSDMQAVYAWTEPGAGGVSAIAVETIVEPAEPTRAARLNRALSRVPIAAGDQVLAWVPGMKPSIDDVLAAVSARGVAVHDSR